MIKAVIWDMGGVLLRTVDQAPRIALAKELGIDLTELNFQVFESESSRRATLGQIPEQDHWQQVARHFRLDEVQLRDFQSRFWEGDRLDQQLCEFVRSLRSSVSTGLLSNAWSGARQMLQKRCDLAQTFDQSIFSAEVGLAKPDAAIYLEILSRLGVQPGESIFVDDFPANVDAANKIGIHGLLFTGSEKVREEVVELLRE